MRVAIVKYNAGNVQSVKNALARLGINFILTNDPEVLRSADKVIFPGVGEARAAVRYLKERNLDAVIKSLRQPVLAICLGMQLLCQTSEEGDTECLGILACRTRRFPDLGIKIPHVGWNTISDLESELFKGISEGSRFYFLHGFYVEKSGHTIAKTTYGLEFSAAAAHKNFYGVQFHPEKSGKDGAKILENFLKLS